MEEEEEVHQASRLELKPAEVKPGRRSQFSHVCPSVWF